MAVEKQYLSDVKTILSHRYDNGADLWATPDLIFSVWQEDGRFKIYPKGSIYPCQTAIAANVLCLN